MNSSSIITILPFIILTIALVLRAKSYFQKDSNVICGLIKDNFVIQLQNAQ
jgi:hypothetical protein